MALNFEVAGGTVAGRDHRVGVPKNRQDDYCILQSPELIVTMITDGCGSGRRSEVGASLGARLYGNYLYRYLSAGWPCDQALLDRSLQHLLSHVDQLAIGMSQAGLSYGGVINDYFLFTLLGAVILPETATFFVLGDGLAAINGEIAAIAPEEGNQPIYASYALTGSTLTDADPSKLRVKLIGSLPTIGLATFMLGSDGSGEIQARAQALLPGTDQPIGRLEQFWTGDRPLSDVRIERRLNLMTRDAWRVAPSGRQVLDGGKIGDDVTIVTGRNLDHPANSS